MGGVRCRESSGKFPKFSEKFLEFPERTRSTVTLLKFWNHWRFSNKEITEIFNIQLKFSNRETFPEIQITNLNTLINWWHLFSRMEIVVRITEITVIFSDLKNDEILWIFTEILFIWNSSDPHYNSQPRVFMYGLRRLSRVEVFYLFFTREKYLELNEL